LALKEYFFKRSDKGRTGKPSFGGGKINIERPLSKKPGKS